MRPLAEVLKDWEAVIGLEVHTALTSLETKLFCACRLSHDDEPNTNVCPVCLGLPGALPVPNQEAVRATVMAGLATNCQIMRRSLFYRKHYFYPDMAKNFQTTQGPVAFCMHGRLDLALSGDAARERPDDSVHKNPDGSYEVPIRILRIHLEEDAAKMVHVGGDEGRIGGAYESLIDYNRCGTPLIELVTEPDLRTPEEARHFMEKLRETFLCLGISDCSLERGSMRCDGNVSLRRRGEAGLGTKTELKNLNSLKALHDALAFEICRQAELLEAGEALRQETRHWEPSRRQTKLMRVKETNDDYRFFPDPDLAPFDLADDFVEECRQRLPELPDAKRERYVRELGIKRYDAARIAGEPAWARLFEEAVGTDVAHAQLVANVVVNLVPACPGAHAEQVRGLARLLAEDAVSFAQARELLAEAARSGADVVRLADERGLRKGAGALDAVVREVLARCEEQARQYRAGNKKVLGYLVGQCMKASGGTGNPKKFGQLLEDWLSR